jgi:hypothetical protein
MPPERAASSFSGYPSRDMTAACGANPHPLGNLLEPRQRAGGLGELSLALARRRPRRLVGLGHLTDERADVVEGRGDVMKGSRSLQSKRPYRGKGARREKRSGWPPIAAEIVSLRAFNVDKMSILREGWQASTDARKQIN